eukprot:s23_g11.t1
MGMGAGGPWITDALYEKSRPPSGQFSFDKPSFQGPRRHRVPKNQTSIPRNYTAEHNAAYVAKPVNDEILALCRKPSTLKAQFAKELDEIVHSISQLSLASCSTGIMSSDSLPQLAEEEVTDFDLLTISDGQPTSI